MGVWHKTGPLSYELNHFALSFDPSNNFVGPAHIHEDVTLDKKADQYTGTFKIDQYDPSGNLLAEVGAQITAHHGQHHDSAGALSFHLDDSRHTHIRHGP